MTENITIPQTTYADCNYSEVIALPAGFSYKKSWTNPWQHDLPLLEHQNKTKQNKNNFYGFSTWLSIELSFTLRIFQFFNPWDLASFVYSGLMKARVFLRTWAERLPFKFLHGQRLRTVWGNRRAPLNNRKGLFTPTEGKDEKTILIRNVSESVTGNKGKI